MEKIRYTLDLSFFIKDIILGVQFGLGIGFVGWLCGFGFAKIIDLFKSIIK